VWASLTVDESAEVARLAEARGVRPSELVRSAVLAFLHRPPSVPPGGGGGDAVGVARLEALVATLGRHVETLARVVPDAEAALAEQEDMRSSLHDIAEAVGVLAGSLEPLDEDAPAL
jgi:hypothetical protein